MSELCQGCPGPSVFLYRTNGGNWHQQTGLGGIPVAGAGASQLLDFPSVALIFAEADRVRECEGCRRAFRDAFQIPDLWWASYCRNSNGYFGCEYLRDGFNTWSRFLVKQLRDDDGTRYNWYKINVFTRWVSSTRQTIVLIFDAPPPLLARLPSPLLEHLNPDQFGDPFWIYVVLAGEIVRLQDLAVWAVRDHVRASERAMTPAEKPRPDYRRLHDIARHAIHVSETLDLAVETVQSILARHDDFVATAAEVPKVVSKDIHLRLLFLESALGGLRHRSASNKERLQNEIQLAFNMVAQYDAGISVEIGRAAHSDSAAMRTITFLTLAFLPATFIAAIFGMSFFDFNADSGSWSVSDKFWVYWALAVPTTIVTSVLWHYWQKRSPVLLFGDNQERVGTTGKRNLIARTMQPGIGNKDVER